jgi:hypothetical protein
MSVGSRLDNPTPEEDAIVESSLAYTEIEVQPNETVSEDAQYSISFEAKIVRSKRSYNKETGENISFYLMNVKRTRTLTLGGSPTVIEYENRRRYSQFLTLFEELLARHHHLKFDGFPPKRYDGEADETINERVTGLNAFLQYILEQPTLAEDPSVIEFLSPETLFKGKNEVKRTWFDTFIDYASLPFIALENKFNTDKMVKRHPEMFPESAPSQAPLQAQ